MRRSPRWPLLLCAGSALLAGCAASPAQAPASAQRLMLDQGYSLLHTDAAHLDLLGFVLYFKTQSADVDALITAISAYGKSLAQDLEHLAAEHPSMSIALDPLPEMEKRKRTAMARERAAYFAPVVGHGGIEYERTMLIAMLGALNHESHLCQVMAAEEPDPALKAFLLSSQRRFEELHRQVAALLGRSYFKSHETTGEKR
jgi:hypothetical protein